MSFIKKKKKSSLAWIIFLPLTGSDAVWWLDPTKATPSHYPHNSYQKLEQWWWRVTSFKSITNHKDTNPSFKKPEFFFEKSSINLRGARPGQVVERQLCGGNGLTKILGAWGPVNVNWSPHDQNYEPQLSTSLSLTFTDSETLCEDNGGLSKMMKGRSLVCFHGLSLCFSILTITAEGLFLHDPHQPQTFQSIQTRCSLFHWQH